MLSPPLVAARRPTHERLAGSRVREAPGGTGSRLKAGLRPGRPSTRASGDRESPGGRVSARRGGSRRRGQAGRNRARLAARSPGSGSGTAAWSACAGSPARCGRALQHPSGAVRAAGRGTSRPAHLVGPGRPPESAAAARAAAEVSKKPRGPSPAAHHAALAGHAGTDRSPVSSGKPSWTPGSASFKPLYLGVKDAKRTASRKAMKVGGGGQLVEAGEREGSPPPPRDVWSEEG